MQLLIVLCLVAIICVLGGAASTGLAIAAGILTFFKIVAWVIGSVLVVGFLVAMFGR